MSQTIKDIILSQSKQITHSLEVNNNVRVEGEVDSITLTGMGGSGHPGDLLNALHLTNVPLTIHRSYDLPKIYGKNPLVIASSYSGNTEESLSAYEKAKELGYKLMINTAGGTLAEWAERDHVPHVKIDFPGMQPRHTLFASFVGLATALKNSNLAQDVTSDLVRTAKVLETTIPDMEEESKKLANAFKGVTPIITASHDLAFAAYNFKIQINENAKTPAFWNEFPELNHNELVGFTNPQTKFHVLMLRDADDHPRIKARMDVTEAIYKERGLEVSTFNVHGDTLLEKLFYALSFGLWTSCNLALTCNIDPIPVAGVEAFKQKLKDVAG